MRIGTQLLRRICPAVLHTAEGADKVEQPVALAPENRKETRRALDTYKTMYPIDTRPGVGAGDYPPAPFLRGLRYAQPGMPAPQMDAYKKAILENTPVEFIERGARGRSNLSPRGNVMNLHRTDPRAAVLHEVTHTPIEQASLMKEPWNLSPVANRAITETAAMTTESVATGLARRLAPKFWPYRYMQQHGPRITEVADPENDVREVYEWSKRAHDPNTKLGQMLYQYVNSRKPEFSAVQMEREALASGEQPSSDDQRVPRSIWTYREENPPAPSNDMTPEERAAALALVKKHEWRKPEQ